MKKIVRQVEGLLDIYCDDYSRIPRQAHLCYDIKVKGRNRRHRLTCAMSPKNPDNALRAVKRDLIKMRDRVW